MLALDEFAGEFDARVRDWGITWEVTGFHGADGRVYPFGTDTKVLSTVFEALSAPLIIEVAQRHGYGVAFAKQTFYPDFTLTPRDACVDRIAIDVKTTYQETPSSQITFTLGSYTSYLRDGKKSIRFPYEEYCAHWVVGFVYRRKEGVPAKVYAAQDAHLLPCPYEHVEYFIQEKYKIAGKVPGSGNTTNIGSFSTKNIDDLRAGRGPFAESGPKAFEDYWRQYKS